MTKTYAWGSGMHNKFNLGIGSILCSGQILFLNICLLPQTLGILWADDYITSVYTCSDTELTKPASPSQIMETSMSKSMELSPYSTVGNSMSSYNSSYSPLYTTIALPTKPQSLSSNPPAYDSLYTNAKDYSSLNNSQVAVN